MAAVAVSSANRVEHGSYRLPPATLPNYGCTKEASPNEIAEAWTGSLNSTLTGGDFVNLKSLFMEDSYWRDHLCMSWDYRTLPGAKAIVSFLQDSKKGSRIQSISIDRSVPHRAPAIAPVDFHGEILSCQFWVTVETDVGRGAGIAKLVQDKQDKSRWKAFTFFTALQELKGHEETTGGRRPTGVNHGSVEGRLNWQDRRNAEKEFSSSEPTVLILGAGQGGLASAARLKQLGVETLIVDRNPRIGDNWRNRYHQLVLHDPVWYDHMPYLQFPPNWPIYTPKDKLAEWFESYVKIMELNVWNSTSIGASEWSDETQSWKVTLERTENGKTESRLIHPKHIIQATGHSGEKNFPAHIQGISDFAGDRLCHSSEFSGAKPKGNGKKAVVVGCCNSGHDIAHDFVENGYDVTMVQRSSTYVMTSKNGIDVLVTGLYKEAGLPVDDADLVSMGMTNPVLKRLHVDATKEIARRDAKLLEGLNAAGFKTDKGPDDSGLFMKYFQRGGGYYIDVGASQLIADGKIRMKQGQEITRINARSITFADGSELEADEIIFATGYQNMRGSARKIFGDAVADRVKDVWGFDEEGEIRTMWRKTGHPGFWFMGGNLALSRYYSRLLALQIKGLEAGLTKYDDA